MKEFIARNPKQLDLCLKLLYAEKVGFIVEVREDQKRKITYSVMVKVESERFAELEEKYRILIS